MGLKYALAAVSSPTSFIAQCVATGVCNGVWLPPAAAAGAINTGDTLLADVTGTSVRVVKAVLAAPGNWVWDAADKPGSGGFAKSINTQTNRGAANYMGIDAALAATSTVIFFGKTQTAQAAGQGVQYGGPTGSNAAPNGDESTFCEWEDVNVWSYRKGAGDSTSIPHSDYTGWFVCSFAGGQNITGLCLSQVGAAFNSIGDDDAVNITGWTGFNAFSGTAADNRESGTGTVKYAGIAMFSTVLANATVHSILLNGGIVTS